MAYIDCRACPVRTKPLFRPFSDGELEFVRAIKQDQIDIPPREHIVHAGDNGSRLYTLFSGWAFRYLMLADDRRQILDFLLPGDLIGLQSPLTGKVRYSICSITAVSVCVHDGQPFRAIFETQPQFSEALVQTLLIEEARADRRLLLLGRQRATERLTYLMLELRDRLIARDMAAAGVCRIPLTYEQMADATGLSRAQLARALKELREIGWLTIAHAEARFGDIDAMARFCDYVPTDQPPRAIV